MFKCFSRVIVLSDGRGPPPEYPSQNFFSGLQPDPPTPGTPGSGFLFRHPLGIPITSHIQLSSKLVAGFVGFSQLITPARLFPGKLS
jgi:hypothetical protein